MGLRDSQRSVLEELDFVACCDYGFDFLDDFRGLIKESVVEVGMRKETDGKQGGELVEQLPPLFDKLHRSLVASGVPSEAAEDFFTAFVDRWMSEFTDTLADVYFAYFEEMKGELATMKELPNEIKKELALYAQRDSRERIDQCCMKTAGLLPVGEGAQSLSPASETAANRRRATGAVSTTFRASPRADPRWTRLEDETGGDQRETRGIGDASGDGAERRGELGAGDGKGAEAPAQLFAAAGGEGCLPGRS